MSRINLLPRAYLDARRRRQHAALLVAAALAIVAAASTWAGLAHRHLDALDTRVSALQQQAEPVHRDLRAIDQLQSRLHQADTELALYRQLEPAMPLSIMLALVSQTLPDTLALTRTVVELPALRMPDDDEDDQTAVLLHAPAPITIQLTGRAESDIAVGRFVHQLAATHPFDNVSLAYARQAQDDREPAYEFRIHLEIATDQPIRVVEREEDAHAG